MIFKKKKPYKNTGPYIAAGELIQLLQTVPEDAEVSATARPNRLLLLDFNYHEITGVVLS